MHSRRWCLRHQSRVAAAVQDQPREGATARSPGAAWRGVALPLTLLAQKVGAAAANAGRIHDTQTPVSFWASLLDTKRLPCWTVERPIGLKRKVLCCEGDHPCSVNNDLKNLWL